MDGACAVPSGSGMWILEGWRKMTFGLLCEFVGRREVVMLDYLREAAWSEVVMFDFLGEAARRRRCGRLITSVRLLE